MKKVILILFTTILFQCCEEDNSPVENSGPGSQSAKHLETELRGCSKAGYMDEPTDFFGGDTVIVTQDNDTTKIKVNLWYICEWRFEDAFELTDDTLFLTIIDTCTNNCGAWCYCDYIFDYKFENLSGKNIAYKAYYESQRKDSKIIGTGIIP